ncbi:hypothetical protein BKA69DRAFT_1151147, partial [Paraphysoderma sedebokerense]
PVLRVSRLSISLASRNAARPYHFDSTTAVLPNNVDTASPKFKDIQVQYVKLLFFKTEYHD